MTSWPEKRDKLEAKARALLEKGNDRAVWKMIRDEIKGGRRPEFWVLDAYWRAIDQLDEERRLVNFLTFVDSRRHSLLFEAVRQDHEPAILHLLSYPNPSVQINNPADITPPLFMACANLHGFVINKLMRGGADIHAPCRITGLDSMQILEALHQKEQELGPRREIPLSQLKNSDVLQFVSADTYYASLFYELYNYASANQRPPQPVDLSDYARNHTQYTRYISQLDQNDIADENADPGALGVLVSDLCENFRYLELDFQDTILSMYAALEQNTPMQWTPELRKLIKKKILKSGKTGDIHRRTLNSVVLALVLRSAYSGVARRGSPGQVSVYFKELVDAQLLGYMELEGTSDFPPEYAAILVTNGARCPDLFIKNDELLKACLTGDDRFLDEISTNGNKIAHSLDMHHLYLAVMLGADISYRPMNGELAAIADPHVELGRWRGMMLGFLDLYGFHVTPPTDQDERVAWWNMIKDVVAWLADTKRPPVSFPPPEIRFDENGEYIDDEHRFWLSKNQGRGAIGRVFVLPSAMNCLPLEFPWGEHTAWRPQDMDDVTWSRLPAPHLRVTSRSRTCYTYLLHYLLDRYQPDASVAAEGGSNFPLVNSLFLALVSTRPDTDHYDLVALLLTLLPETAHQLQVLRDRGLARFPTEPTPDLLRALRYKTMGKKTIYDMRDRWMDFAIFAAMPATVTLLVDWLGVSPMGRISALRHKAPAPSLPTWGSISFLARDFDDGFDPTTLSYLHALIIPYFMPQKWFSEALTPERTQKVADVNYLVHFLLERLSQEQLLTLETSADLQEHGSLLERAALGPMVPMALETLVRRLCSVDGAIFPEVAPTFVSAIMLTSAAKFDSGGYPHSNEHSRARRVVAGPSFYYSNDWQNLCGMMLYVVSVYKARPFDFDGDLSAPPPATATSGQTSPVEPLTWIQIRAELRRGTPMREEEKAPAVEPVQDAKCQLLLSLLPWQDDQFAEYLTRITDAMDKSQNKASHDGITPVSGTDAIWLAFRRQRGLQLQNFPYKKYDMSPPVLKYALLMEKMAAKVRFQNVAAVHAKTVALLAEIAPPAEHWDKRDLASLRKAVTKSLHHFHNPRVLNHLLDTVSSLVSRGLMSKRVMNQADAERLWLLNAEFVRAHLEKPTQAHHANNWQEKGLPKLFEFLRRLKNEFGINLRAACPPVLYPWGAEFFPQFTSEHYGPLTSRVDPHNMLWWHAAFNRIELVLDMFTIGMLELDVHSRVDKTLIVVDQTGTQYIKRDPVTNNDPAVYVLNKTYDPPNGGATVAVGRMGALTYEWLTFWLKEGVDLFEPIVGTGPAMIPTLSPADARKRQKERAADDQRLLEKGRIPPPPATTVMDDPNVMNTPTFSPGMLHGTERHLFVHSASTAAAAAVDDGGSSSSDVHMHDVNAARSGYSTMDWLLGGWHLYGLTHVLRKLMGLLPSSSYESATPDDYSYARDLQHFLEYRDVFGRNVLHAFADDPAELVRDKYLEAVPRDVRIWLKEKHEILRGDYERFAIPMAGVIRTDIGIMVPKYMQLTAQSAPVSNMLSSVGAGIYRVWHSMLSGADDQQRQQFASARDRLAILWSQRDSAGNTPMHLAARFNRHLLSTSVCFPFFSASPPQTTLFGTLAVTDATAHRNVLHTALLSMESKDFAIFVSLLEWYTLYGPRDGTDDNPPRPMLTGLAYNQFYESYVAPKTLVSSVLHSDYVGTGNLFRLGKRRPSTAKGKRRLKALKKGRKHGDLDELYWPDPHEKAELERAEDNIDSYAQLHMRDAAYKEFVHATRQLRSADQHTPGPLGDGKRAIVSLFVAEDRNGRSAMDELAKRTRDEQRRLLDILRHAEVYQFEKARMIEERKGYWANLLSEYEHLDQESEEGRAWIRDHDADEVRHLERMVRRPANAPSMIVSLSEEYASAVLAAKDIDTDLLYGLDLSKHKFSLPQDDGSTVVIKSPADQPPWYNDSEIGWYEMVMEHLLALGAVVSPARLSSSSSGIRSLEEQMRLLTFRPSQAARPPRRMQ